MTIDDIETKNCYKCNDNKPLIEFVTRKNICKYCDNKRKRDDNKRNVRKLYTYLLEHPCIDCGIKDPLVLQFDHQEDKHKNVSTLVGNSSWIIVEKEIAKCVVRCANCHQKKTAKEFEYYMWQIATEEKQKEKISRLQSFSTILLWPWYM